MLLSSSNGDAHCDGIDLAALTIKERKIRKEHCALREPFKKPAIPIGIVSPHSWHIWCVSLSVTLKKHKCYSCEKMQGVLFMPSVSLYCVCNNCFACLTCHAGMCLEKRTFYRLISGLHTSINIHLCDQYLFPCEY